MGAPAKLTRADRAAPPSPRAGFAPPPMAHAHLTRARLATGAGPAWPRAHRGMRARDLVWFGEYQLHPRPYPALQLRSCDPFAARLPRVLMGAAVGATLAALGAALQALVRNPRLPKAAPWAFPAERPSARLSRWCRAIASEEEPRMVPVAGFIAALISTLAVYRLGQCMAAWSPSACCW